MKTTIFFAAIWILLLTSSCRKNDFANAVKTSSADLSTQASSKPNIILILADDVGYEIPTYSGGESYSTPNIDYLAANGTWFTQCHASPLCSPSRFTLMTAKYNFRNYTTWGVMDTTQRTIANLLQSNGYATCAAGKWQFDGGDASIHALGFDKYMVTNPVKEQEDDPKNIYKNPVLYSNGAFLPTQQVNGKYGEDLVRDYMFNFIDSNKGKKPFFVYWATNLCHAPFCPTPDDPQFATWDPNKKMVDADTVYFPSMVKYMDKLVGQLITKLRASNLLNNTVILYSGDNGTTNGLHSWFKGQVIEGGKSLPTEAGTHVPLLAYWLGKIRPGVVDTSLVSFVDFMPSLADFAGTKVPASYGIIDGISFTPQFSGDFSNVRPWIFCHYPGAGKYMDDPTHLKRWMQGYTYKQYDTLVNKQYSKKFYNISADILEKNPIPTRSMTPQQKAISKQYLQLMSQLH